MLDYRYVDTGQVRLAYRRWDGPGDAMPLVLLHGGGGDGTTWDGLAPGFAKRRPVYAPDLRGMGQSERTAEPDRFAATVESFLASARSSS